MATCQGAGFDPDISGVTVPLNLGYKATLGLIEQLRACGEVVATRTNNWQVYCHKEKSKMCMRACVCVYCVSL